MEDTNEGLPSGYKEVKRAETSLEITERDLPWMDKKHLDSKTRIKIVPLAYIRIEGDIQFYLGSAIVNDNLVDAAERLDSQGPKGSEITNKVLYAHLPEYIKGTTGIADPVDNPRSERPIYYVGSRQGKRIYFIRFDNKDGVPIILKIAACDKDRQQQVLRVIATSSYKHNKYVGRL